jgi:transcriptional pleiotropic regulator of transition state genes
MKSTGVCRQVDELGRIVLPISIRKNLDIHVKDNMEIYTDGDKIILKKRQISCIFCGNSDNVVAYNEKLICQDCMKELRKL